MAFRLPLGFRPVGGAVLSLAFAITSNAFFTGRAFARTTELSGAWRPEQNVGLVFLLLAIAASAWAFWPRGISSFGEMLPSSIRPAGELSRKDCWKILPFLTFFSASISLYLRSGENGWVHFCWAASLVALLVPFVRSIHWGDAVRIEFWEYALLTIITIVGFTLRFVDLTELPYHVDNDVSIMGLYSRQLIETSNWNWVGMAPTNHQLSEHQIQAISMRLFGNNHFGLSMLGVLVGTATIPSIYLVGRLCFNRWVGLLAAALLCFDYVHIHFSRIVFGPWPTLCVTLAAGFLAYGLRRRSAIAFALSGMATGAALLGYYSGRVAPVLALALGAVWLIRRSNREQIPLGYWILLGLGVLAVFGPNTVYGLAAGERFNGRGNDVLLWSAPAWRYAHEEYGADASLLKILIGQFKRTFLTPYFFPDTSVICYLRKPMVGVLAGVGLTLGVGFSLPRALKITFAIPLLWVCLTFVFGGVLTSNPPFWPHLNIALPGLALLSAIGIERFFNAIYPRVRQAQAALVAGLVIVVIAAGIQNWAVYYRFARDHASGDVHATRQLKKLSADYRVFLISDSLRWTQESFRFLTPQLEGTQWTNKQVNDPLPTIDRPTVFIVFEDADPRWVVRLGEAYPGRLKQLYYDGWGWPVFTMIRTFPPGYVESPQIGRRVDEELWNLPGARYLGAFMVAAVCFGCVLLRRDLRRAKLLNASEPLVPKTTGSVGGVAQLRS